MSCTLEGKKYLDNFLKETIGLAKHGKFSDAYTKAYDLSKNIDKAQGIIYKIRPDTFTDGFSSPWATTKAYFFNKDDELIYKTLDDKGMSGLFIDESYHQNEDEIQRTRDKLYEEIAYCFNGLETLEEYQKSYQYEFLLSHEGSFKNVAVKPQDYEKCIVGHRKILFTKRLCAASISLADLGYINEAKDFLVTKVNPIIQRILIQDFCVLSSISYSLSVWKYPNEILERAKILADNLYERAIGIITELKGITCKEFKNDILHHFIDDRFNKGKIYNCILTLERLGWNHKKIMDSFLKRLSVSNTMLHYKIQNSNVSLIAGYAFEKYELKDNEEQLSLPLVLMKIFAAVVKDNEKVKVLNV